MSPSSCFPRFIRRMVAARFSLLIPALVLLGAPYGAFYAPGWTGLLEGLFDLEETGRWGLAALLFHLAATTSQATTLLIWHQQGHIVPDSVAGKRLGWRCWLLFRFLGLPGILGILAACPAEGRLACAGWCVAGIASALVMEILATYLHLRVHLGRGRGPDILVPTPVADWVARGIDSGAFRRCLAVLGRPHPGLRATEPATRGDEGVSTQARSKAGTNLALSLLLVYSVVYVVLALASNMGAGAPAIVFFLLSLILGVWVVAGLGHWLDERGIPLLAIVIPGSLIVAWLFAPDHVFELREDIVSRSPKASPARETSKPAPRMVVVVASGGGIQAAGWTAQVLAGLEGLGRQTGVPFGRRTLLLSGVSGGNLGLACFVDAYRDDGQPDPGRLREVAPRSMRSALSAVTWGFAYPDLLRTLVPPLANVPAFRPIDRAFALEEAWRRNGGPTNSLSEWRREANLGLKPHVIFNSTVVETGQRFLFATLDQSPWTRTNSPCFFETFPGKDIDILTAVRLSATFPFVTPVARADLDGVPHLHFADGGYYDNTGLNSAIEWLHDRLLGDPDLEVIVIRIEAFPVDPVDHKGARGGFLFQNFAPVQTLMSVRTASQRARALLELELLRRATQRGGQDRVVSRAFTFQSEGAPLSWHLTQPQKDAIRQEWEKQTKLGRAVIDHLARHPDRDLRGAE